MIEAFQNLYGDVWAITPQAHQNLAEMARANYSDDKTESAFPETVIVDGVQIISVKGVLVPSVDAKTAQRYGLCSCEMVQMQLETASIRPDVKGVLMIYDTPGGHVPGTPALANVVAEFEKPIVGYVRSGCSSGGYWLACSQILYSEPEASVGGIGTYLVLRDGSKMMEMQGLKTILLSTGEHKGAGEFGTEITDAQIQHLKDEVITPIGNMFFNHVKAYRQLPDELMDGRSWRGVRAQELNLIDAVGSMRDAYTELLTLIQEQNA